MSGYNRTNPYASQDTYNTDNNRYGNAPAFNHQADNPYGNTSGNNQHNVSTQSRLGTPHQAQSNPYATTQVVGSPPSQYSSTIGVDDNVNRHSMPYSNSPSPGQTILSTPDFLTRVETAKRDIDRLSENIGEIATLHQRSVSSPDGSSSSALENIVAQTQVRNTKIRDQIKYLETDAARSGGNATKNSQVRTLKNQFKRGLEQYRDEEVAYKKRYQEQIARQYRIVNPNASEGEVREAVEVNWGDEGVFQTALRSNRTGAATTVLGAVRARHHDIQNIERTLIELNQLFQDMAETVEVQSAAIQETEKQTEHVYTDTEMVNKKLGKGIENARRARKLKWCCFTLVVVIVLIVAGVGGYFIKRHIEEQ